MHIWKELPLISSLLNGSQIFVVFYTYFPAIKDLLKSREMKTRKSKTDGDIGLTDSLMSSLTLVSLCGKYCHHLFLAPTRSSRKANVRPSVRSFVRSVQTCLELSNLQYSGRVSSGSLQGLFRVSSGSLHGLFRVSSGS